MNAIEQLATSAQRQQQVSDAIGAVAATLPPSPATAYMSLFAAMFAMLSHLHAVQAAPAPAQVPAATGENVVKA